MELSLNGCRVAVDEKAKVVGTVTTVRYQDHFSWIGMVLVDPNRQREGIGLQLLKVALELLGDVTTARLDATPKGREVYMKLGFVDEYDLTRMEWNPISHDKLPVSDVRPMIASDLAELFNLDDDVFGANRQFLLKPIFHDAQQFAFVLEDTNAIKGYCMGRTGYHFTHIGPVVAPNLDGAVKLVSAAIRNAKKNPVILDVPKDATAWNNWLSSVGFNKQRSLTRMFRGTNAHRGKPEKQFAILGPEFG